MLSNVLPSNCPYLYVYNAESQVVLYTGNDFTDLTGMFETNGGDIWLLTKLNEPEYVQNDSRICCIVETPGITGLGTI